jgi:hypothetical protein
MDWFFKDSGPTIIASATAAYFVRNSRPKPPSINFAIIFIQKPKLAVVFFEPSRFST